MMVDMKAVQLVLASVDYLADRMAENLVAEMVEKTVVAMAGYLVE